MEAVPWELGGVSSEYRGGVWGAAFVALLVVLLGWTRRSAATSHSAASHGALIDSLWEPRSARRMVALSAAGPERQDS